MWKTFKNPKQSICLLAVLCMGVSSCLAQTAPPAATGTGLDTQSRKVLDAAGQVLTNVNQSSSSMDVILGNPKNVEAINGLIGTNMNLGIEQIRAATMPTIATSPTARNLPLTLFETYANTAEKDKTSVDQYLKIMETIRDDLRSGNFLAANEKALALKDFDFDGGISENIRNRVRASMEAKSEILKMDKEIEKYEKERRSKELLAGAQKVAPQSSGSSGGQSTTTGDNNTVVNTPKVDTAQFSKMLENAYKATRREEDRLIAAGKMGAKELEKVKKDIETRQDFRSYISSLMASQQYAQGIIAIDFYRAIYNDGDYSNELSMMYNTGLEADKQGKSEIEAFKYKYDNAELAGASERLLSAFMTSRNLPQLLIVPRTEKRKVSEYLRGMSELESLLMVKDYQTADDKIQSMRKEAKDFDFSKAMSLVNNGKMRSNFALGMAKLSAQQGKPEEAQKYFYAAAELWPTNPELKTASQSFFTTSDTKEQYTAEFDRYWTEENWRAMYENRLKYAAALDGDKARIAKFEKAMKKVEAVEVAMMKAEELKKAQNPAAAWEALEKASGEWSEDIKLNKMMAELAEQSADFIKAIRNARSFESKGQWGAAVVWYLQAQSFNPTSDLANTGIQKSKDKILNTNFAAGSL